MNDFLSRAVSQWRPSFAAQILLGVFAAAAAVIIRFPIEPLLRGSVPYITFFPAVMLAALLVGRASGSICLLSSAVLSAYFFVPPAMSFKIGSQGGFGLLVFLISGGLIWLCATQLRRTLLEMSAAREREERVSAEQKSLNGKLLAQSTALAQAQDSLRAIFDASSEGLTLCRLMRDEQGKAYDYQVLDVNPAHRMLTAATREQMLSKPVSQIAPPISPRWIKSAAAAVELQTTQTFEVRSPATGRWLDIHVSPVRGDLFAQTFIDVTTRREAEEQRIRLVAEMNHRVKNNFQTVASILTQQARRTDNAETREQLRGAVHRVHLLAELHDSLSAVPDAGEIDFQAYLAAVCERLRGSIEDQGRIRINLTGCEAELDVDYAVPLGFIVNELVTNAIKYAYPAPAHGDIDVSFACRDDDYLLRIADSGRGVPNEKGASTQQGLGMVLVSGFVAQIGGTMDVRNGSGVEYSIRFPRKNRSGVALQTTA